MTEREKQLESIIQEQAKRIKYLEAENKGLHCVKENLERQIRKVWSYGR